MKIRSEPLHPDGRTDMTNLSHFVILRLHLVSNIIQFGVLFYVVHTNLHVMFCYFYITSNNVGSYHYSTGTVKMYCFTHNALTTANPKHEAGILEIKCAAVPTERVFMYTSLWY